MPDQKPIIDAGVRNVHHYKNRLPSWRYAMRNALIPIVRWETPVLAKCQDRFRTPTLDSYFAFTANLGTHTFFMIFLPILFWCGYPRLGRAMVHVLSTGVFFSGWLKDLLCLPRPLSPPLQRISRSASAALEYGFPSTHSTNAVSVALYCIWILNKTDTATEGPLYFALLGLFTFYALSIMIGRLYCGMHGFFDVVIGSLLGAIITAIQVYYEDAFDAWSMFGPIWNPIIITLVVLTLVRTHPEPADDCPCFDDSVAFSGVFLGIEISGWRSARNPLFAHGPVPGPPFDYQQQGVLIAAVRILVGVLVVFTWRGVMKPALFKGLPPLFRLIESAGADMPRRFFLRASEYKHVPPLRKDDNVIPPASEIPAMIGSLRHVRKRAISIGPQSQADAYEAIAFRERKRRESQNSVDGAQGIVPNGQPARPAFGPRAVTSSVAVPTVKSDVTFAVTDENGKDVVAKADQEADRTISQGSREANSNNDTAVDYTAEDAAQDKAMFLTLQKPRVRYDVEVVTKLIIYAGIAWWSLEGVPRLFDVIGLNPHM